MVVTSHMKSTPNYSTSPAKKSKTLRRIGGWAATELRFGLVQVLTYVRTCLTPIFEISIFPPIEVAFPERTENHPLGILGWARYRHVYKGNYAKHH